MKAEKKKDIFIVHQQEELNGSCLYSRIAQTVKTAGEKEDLVQESRVGKDKRQPGYHQQDKAAE